MKRSLKFVFLMALVILVGCKKEPQTNVPVVKLHEDEVVVTRNNVELVAEVAESSGLDVIEKGFVYGMGDSFQDTVFCENDSVCFSIAISNLQENTTYCYKAFARNSVGTGWSETLSFATGSFDLPLVMITNGIVTSTSVCVYCAVADDGGLPVSELGICWSVSPNPTVDDNQVVCHDMGMGNFTCTFSVMNVGVTYYVRPYATNSKGLAYGEQKEFYIDWLEKPFSVNGVSFKMIMVLGGTFCMGAQRDDPNGRNYDEDADYDEAPVHDVTLDNYYIGETEVTQQLWKAVMGENPSYAQTGSGVYNRPVEQVSWDVIVNEFLPKLNALTGREFRLPTEAEWEFAARGGNKSKGFKYSGSNNIKEVAFYVENSKNRTWEALSLTPNELKLYGMSGNVWEWCSDWYGDYQNGSSNNPHGALSGRYRVLRGGGFRAGANLCRPTSRNCNRSSYRNYATGFRLALSTIDDY